MGERIFTRDDAKSIIRTTSDKVKLPSDFTVIGRGALAGFSQVKELTIPEGVRRICTHAFFIRVFKGKSSLEKLVIPASLQEFERWCFFDCNSLKSVILPEGFDEKQAMELFFQCPEATLTFGKKLLFGSKGKTVQQIMDETSGILTLGGASLLQIEKNGDLVIPQSYQYILPHAMRNLGTRGVKRLILHPKMRIISPNAFACMETLEEVVLAEGTEFIDNYAFAGCKKLRRIVIPDSVTQIGAGAFMNLPSLEAIRLPKGLKEISDEMLSGCTSLKTVVFGDQITHIGAGAFHDCTALTEMRLPESVRTIGVGAFWNCSALYRLAIPSGAESLSQSSLGNCPNLKYLYVPHIIHDALEQERILTDKTNPEIIWLEEGDPLPVWSDADLTASDSAASPADDDIAAAMSALTHGVSQEKAQPSGLTAHVTSEAGGTAHGEPVSGVDAQTVQQMQDTIAAMQAQLAALSQQLAVSALPQVNA